MTTPPQTGHIRVGANVYAFFPESGANGGFMIGDEGVIVVEGQMTRAGAQEVKEEVKRITDLPIRSVILTHFHGDHSLGNQYFLPAPIIGHALCRDEFIEKWDYTVNRFATRYDATDPAQAAEFRSARMTPPDVVFHNDRMTLFLGERPIELLYFGWAHTRGDIFVYLPDDKVLYSGDAITSGGPPVTMHAHIGNWVSVLEKVEALDINTIVPGHGLLGGRDMVSRERQFLSQLRDEARKRYDAGVSAEKATEDITIPGFEAWAEGEQFVTGIQRLYMEFRGEL